MQRASALFTLALVAAMPVIGTGCVQQDKYDALLESNRSLQEQLVATEDQRDVAKGNLESLRGQLSDARNQVNQISAQNNALKNELAKATGDYDSLMQRISALDVGPLPSDVENALTQLAAQYPDVLSFDKRTGMLRFSSDFTFDLGSTEIKGDATNTLQTLAGILNSGSATGFEVKIVGHTDNVPIGQPSTRQLHPTNLHLSVHRSIAVRDALVRSGLEATRVQVAGYGEYRPVVANERRGAAANRRVEIYLTPMPTDAYTAAPTTGNSTTTSVDTDEPMK